jgi:replication factor A1
MKISELQPKQGDVELLVEVVDIGEQREFNKFGKSGRVATATVKDETGQISLSLWNEQIDQIHVGDALKVNGGYVKEWQGELQLTTGMRGNIEIVPKGEAPVFPKEPEKGQTELSGSEQASETPEEPKEATEEEKIGE